MDMEYESNVDIVQVDNTIEVTAEVQNFTICTDDIYIIERNADLPEWFENVLDNSRLSTNLTNSISGLNTLFTNFEDGVTKEVGYLKDRDTELAYDLSVLKTSNINVNAAIMRLDQTKITAEQAEASAQTVIASWFSNGAAGAWFDEKIQTVSNTAMAAARSASSLTASINTSVLPSIQKAFGDIALLQSQVDGKVETWYGVESPVNGDGTINESVEPYASWLAEGSAAIAIHTGDTYVHYEYDAYGKKVILATYRFMYDTDDEEYEWYIFTDDVASLAYNAALSAQGTADSKTATWFQPEYPIFNTEEERYNAQGDIWVDSDNNKYYIYVKDSTALTGYRWKEATDTRVQASVNRLDEATVSVDGVARAKSSLSVNANGVVSGYVAESGTTSSFNIYADNFRITNSENTIGEAPFAVDTVNNRVKFTGIVEFNSVMGVPTINQTYVRTTAPTTGMVTGDTWLDSDGGYAMYTYSGSAWVPSGSKTYSQINAPTSGMITGDLWVDTDDGNKLYRYDGYNWINQTISAGTMVAAINSNTNTTTIDGGKITTGSITANHIVANSISTSHISTEGLNADVIKAGVLYNTGGNATSYVMKIDLNKGEIHIR